MTDFVSGRGSNRHEHAVTVHEVPFPSQLIGRNLLYPFHPVERTASRNRIVSIAEQTRLEHEAELRRKAETQAETKKRRSRSVAGATRFGLSPADGGTHATEWRELGDPSPVILRAARIRNEAALVRAAFATILKPNAKDRRRLRRILASLQTELNAIGPI